MYLEKPNKNTWAADIETDSLIPSVIWVLCVENCLTGEKKTFTEYDEMRDFVNSVLETEDGKFVGHNFLRFDGPVLNRFLGTRITVGRMVDTLVLSMVYSPSFAGGHSLDSWGDRLGMPKGKYSDWSKLTDEMIVYCIQDTSITAVLYVKLVQRMLSIGFSEQGVYIEHRSWWLIKKQMDNGFHFNQKEGLALYTKLRGIEDELKERIYKFWPPALQLVKQFARARKANGEPTANYIRHNEQYPKIEITGEGYSAFDFVEFNLGSPSQRVQKLLELGWRPREFTKPSKSHPEGQPKVTEKGELVESLQEFLEETPHEGARLLAEWLTINNRASMVGTWLDAYNEKTGCIHGTLWLANTFRYRHSNPNTANIPAVRLCKEGKPLLGSNGAWTYEARDVWTTRDASNRRLVGVDATGIQFRILANYLNDEEFTNVVLAGDIHEYNKGKTGVGTRGQNKTFGYAALLGAGGAKVGAIFGVSANKGASIKNKWIKTVPGLSDLYDRLGKELKRDGRITLCDGSKLIVTSPHTVLAYLLQGDESRIMKQAKIFVDEECRREKLDALFVGDIHDEWQVDVRIEHVERFIEICRVAFKKAGLHFGYNIPIACAAKVGKTWAETH